MNELNMFVETSNRKTGKYSLNDSSVKRECHAIYKCKSKRNQVQQIYLQTHGNKLVSQKVKIA